MKYLITFFLILAIQLVVTHGQYAIQVKAGDKNGVGEDSGNKAWPFPIYFDCYGRERGFYADYYRGCKVFYYCEPDGTMIPFMCPEDYIFDESNEKCSPPSLVYCPPYQP